MIFRFEVDNNKLLLTLYSQSSWFCDNGIAIRLVQYQLINNKTTDCQTTLQLFKCSQMHQMLERFQLILFTCIHNIFKTAVNF